MRKRNFMMSRAARSILALALAFACSMPALADGGVTFTDIADGGGAGITYERTPSPRNAIRQAINAAAPLTGRQFLVARANSPQKPRGAPGVAVFDHDGDGDLDIYVANGPGTPNSLYSNQLRETGATTFIDVGVAAGVGAASQDSAGVCYGDIDNDGDEDLYVVGSGDPGILFENNGDGTFTDITASANAGGPTPARWGVACSFGDVNNDGFLDLVVANTYGDCPDPVNPFTGQQYPCSWDGNPAGVRQYGWEHRLTVFSVAFPIYPVMEHNVLLVNNGNHGFTDASAASGIENVSGMAGPGLSGASFTWAIAMWDFNLDGNIDIHNADNQGSGGVSIGWHRFFSNDGAGNFTDVTQSLALDQSPGSWMGIAPGDFNCDGRMDFFATDLGIFLTGSPGASSRWFLQNPDGTFTHPGMGPLVGTPFGWGTATFDYDNDGDLDVIYHGSVDILAYTLADNPGALLQNTGNCTAEFTWDSTAILKDHTLRTVEGVATADINDDGFFDIVSVSGFDIEPGNPNFRPAIVLTGGPTGSPFDAVASFQNQLTSAITPGRLTPVVPFPNFPNGSLAVELSSADNGNGWAKVELLGSAGILAGGTVNRDGIGATVAFTPDGGPTSRRPILGGASYASQNSLEVGVGLGSAGSGTLEVLWPGGVRNRLYGVGSGERILMPHIPCAFDGAWGSKGLYNACVMQALNTYKNAGFITEAERNRLRDSARQAFDEAQGN